MIKHFLIVLSFLLISTAASATHLLGGTITYKYVSTIGAKVTYVITLPLYRDCQQEVQFDQKIKIGIYHNNVNKSKYITKEINLISKDTVPVKCYTSGCIELGIYSDTVTVYTSSLGYYITYIRCCRANQNNIKTGIDQSPDNGFTFVTFISPSKYKNNAPTSDFEPSLINPINKATIDNWGATDSDGDSLVYEIAPAYQGGAPTGNGSEPDPSATYVAPLSVNYATVYSYTLPFGTSGSATIDKTTGMLAFTNPFTGLYAFCVEIKEYRKGAFIGLYRRDYSLYFINTPPENRFQIKLLKPQFVTNKSVALSWNICPNTFPTYTIEHKEKTTAWEVIGTTTKRDNFINTITNNVMHYYRIKAVLSGTEIISNMDSAYIKLTGLNGFSKRQISIFPNPAHNYLVLKNQGIVYCSVYDITGKLHLMEHPKETDSELKLNIASLQSGLYFILITTDKGLISGRFVKE